MALLSFSGFSAHIFFLYFFFCFICRLFFCFGSDLWDKNIYLNCCNTFLPFVYAIFLFGSSVLYFLFIFCFALLCFVPERLAFYHQGYPSAKQFILSPLLLSLLMTALSRVQNKNRRLTGAPVKCETVSVCVCVTRRQ